MKSRGDRGRFSVTIFFDRVLSNTNYDRQEEDACITISGRVSVDGGSGFDNDKELDVNF